jgi:hypothetical protein
MGDNNSSMEDLGIEKGSILERKQSFLEPFSNLGQPDRDLIGYDEELDRIETQTGFIRQQSLELHRTQTGRKSLKVEDAIHCEETVIVTFKEADPGNPQNWSKCMSI